MGRPQRWTAKPTGTADTADHHCPPEKLKDLQESLLPAFEKSKITKKEAASSMECAHEFLKAQPKDKSVVDMVCQSLKKDKKSHTKVRIAEKMHKRMLKCN